MIAVDNSRVFNLYNSQEGCRRGNGITKSLDPPIFSNQKGQSRGCNAVDMHWPERWICGELILKATPFSTKTKGRSIVHTLRSDGSEIDMSWMTCTHLI